MRDLDDGAAGAGGWIEWYGRVGYVAKAAVYIVAGLLALRMSVGAPAEPPNTSGVLATVLFRPFGDVLLGLLTFGLFGYAFWQLVAAFVDGEHDGSDVPGRLMRLGKVWGALVYTLLTVEAAGFLLGRLGGREKTEAWTASVMSFPLGQALVTVVGAGIVTYGLYQFYAAYAPRLDHHLDLSSLSDRAVTLAGWIGRFGLVARGIVFVIVGTFLVRAAIHYDPREAAGLGETFVALGRQPLGQGLLAALGAGFVAYGCFELFDARYRRLNAT